MNIASTYFLSINNKSFRPDYSPHLHLPFYNTYTLVSSDGCMTIKQRQGDKEVETKRGDSEDV